MSDSLDQVLADFLTSPLVSVNLFRTTDGYRWWCDFPAGRHLGEHVAVIVALRQLLEHCNLVHEDHFIQLTVDPKTAADLGWSLDLRLLTPGRSRV
jgi:hypothetical protein